MKKIVALIIVILLVISGVLLVKKRKEADKKIPPAKIYPLVVKEVAAKNGHIILTQKYLALVKSNKSVTITSKFAGKLEYVANLGDKVKKGELIAKIDDTALKNNLESVKSSINALQKSLLNQKSILANLKDTLKRDEKLYKADLVSIEEIKAIKNKILSLKSQINLTKSKLNSLKANEKTIINNLTYAKIFSPVDGIVSAKFLNKGDNVFRGRPIIKISSNSNYLFIPLAKEYKEIIYKDKKYPLIPLKTTFNGLKVYKADVDDKNLVEGQKVNIKVVSFDGNATLIPYNALLSINNKTYVFTPKALEVNVLASGEEGVVIDKNVKNVITASPDILLKIKAGYPIKVKE